MSVTSLQSASFDSSGMPSSFGGLTHTGSVHFTTTAASALSGLSLNGVGQSIAPGQLQSFVCEIDIPGDTVGGGVLSVVLHNGDAFTAEVVGGISRIALAPGGYQINIMLFNGLFRGASFAGVNVSPWFNAQPLSGNSLGWFSFDVVTLGATDGVADFEVSVVPTPAAGGVLGITMLGLSARRRRA